jgi:hypothetical protein
VLLPPEAQMQVAGGGEGGRPSAQDDRDCGSGQEESEAGAPLPRGERRQRRLSGAAG